MSVRSDDGMSSTGGSSFAYSDSDEPSSPRLRILTASAQDLVLVGTESSSPPRHDSAASFLAADERALSPPPQGDAARLRSDNAQRSSTSSPRGELRNSLLSPTLSSSSRAPSSIQDEGLSDISSLDDDDFELIDAAGGGSVAGISDLADSAHWDDTPRLVTPNNVMAAPRADNRLLEVEALNSSLGSTYDFFRTDASSAREADTSNVSTATASAEVSMLTEASTMRGSRSNQRCFLPPQMSDAPSSGAAAQPSSIGDEPAPLPTSGSLFHFPDPMDGARKSEADASERPAERVEKSTSTVPATEALVDSKSSSGGGSVNMLNAASRFSFLSHGNSSAALRNPWDPVPSSRGNISSTADAASRLASSGDRHLEIVNEKLSPEAMAVSSFAGSHPALNTAQPTVQAAQIKTEPAERITTSSVDAAIDARPGPTALPLPAQLNVFYMGSRPAKHVFGRVAQATRESLFSAYEAVQSTAEPLFLGDEVRIDARLGRRPAGVAWTRRTSRKGPHVELQEFDCTSALGDSDATTGSDIAKFLATYGAAELKRGGALIICFLENGERQQRLPTELAALLCETHDLSKPFWSRAQAMPLLLPILCPRSPSNLDEGDSLSSSAVAADGAAAATVSNDLVRALSRQLDLRAAERTWRAVLSATCASINELSATARVTQLAVESAQRSDTVLTYEQFLLGGEAEWFGGDAAWVARAAFRVSPREGTRLGAETEATPTWLSKTAVWLTSLPHVAATTALASSEALRSDGPLAVELTASRATASGASSSAIREATSATQTRSEPSTPRSLRHRLRPTSVSGAGAIIIMLAGVLLALMNGRDIRTPGVVLNRPSPMLAGTDFAALLDSIRGSFGSSSVKAFDAAAAEKNGQSSAEGSSLRGRALSAWESFAAAPPRLMAAVESSRSAFLERHQSSATAPELPVKNEPRAVRKVPAFLLAADKPAGKASAQDGKKPQRASCRDVTVVNQLSKDVAVYQRTRRSRKPSSTQAPAPSTYEHLGAPIAPLAGAAVTPGASSSDHEWTLRLQAETAMLMRDASRGAQQVLGHLVREWSFWVLKLQMFYEQHVLPFYEAQLRPFYAQQVQPRMDAAYKDINARLRDASATIEHTSGIFLQGIRIARGRLYELDLKKRGEAFGKTMEGAARQARHLGSQAIDHVSSAPRQLKAAQQHVANSREMLDKPRAVLRAIERTTRETEHAAEQAAEQITRGAEHISRGARSSIERAVDGARKTKAAIRDVFDELQATADARRKDAVLKMKAFHAAERNAARTQRQQHRKLEQKMSEHLRQKIRESQAQAKAHIQAQVKAGARAAAHVKAKAKSHAERKGKGQRGRRQGHTKA